MEIQKFSCIGIDEAGRGALAGPLILASVCVDNPDVHAKLTAFPVRDSKTLSERQRELIYTAILELQIPFQTMSIEVSDINKKGIGWANTYGIRKLILQGSTHGSWGEVGYPDREVIVDGYFPQKKIAVKGVRVRCQVDADATILPVILAGIVAKVTRDRIMKQLHRDYALYGWEQNKGYGTRNHIDSIKRVGMCPYHRLQFVETALKKPRTH